MIPRRTGTMSSVEPTNPLQMSWHDSHWVPLISRTNVMDYFSNRYNPFYDHTCNNEILKMQRQSLDQLKLMTGLEYILLHIQDPILYIVRKQHRFSPTQVQPLCDYYINAGVIYQAPDLASVINSRISTTVHHLQSALDEVMSYARFHPSKGYNWDIKSTEKTPQQEKEQEPSSAFQRERVDMLLQHFTNKFPLPLQPQPSSSKSYQSEVRTTEIGTRGIKTKKRE